MCCAGGGADLAQPGALVPDHDPLLADDRSTNRLAWMRQRLVVGPVLAQAHLLDDDGDRVRQLVTDALQRGLADQLGDHRLLRLVGELAVRVERRALRQQRDQQVGQQADLVARTRRHRHDLGPVGGGVVAELVDRQQVLPELLGVARSVLVATATSVVRRTFASSLAMNRSPGPIFSLAGKHTADHVDLGQRALHQVVEPLAEQRAGPVQAGGVDEDELASGRCTMPAHDVRVVCGLER